MANSTSIDERIVQMTFNNKEFEKGAKETIKTLGKVEDALKFEANVESLEEAQNYIVDTFVPSIDERLKSLEESFEDHFGFIGTITRKWTEKIADYAFDKLKDLGKLLTIQDIGSGSEKYAKQTKAVQTIVNATGKSIEDVEKVLERLMEYTDETSYDFAEMVNTIGKFTSVGVDLAVAEKAMEGIGNEAAKSGAGVSEANHAMFNFAQALSAGAVKLQDWNSIENANMATKEFKEQLISTAIELGVLEKKGENVGSIVTTNQKQLEAGQEALKKATKLTKNRAEAVAKAQKKIAEATKRVQVDYTSFTETLSSGWLTTDVLVKTLEKYSDTSTEFGRIAFESAQKALTFEDAINAVHDAVSSSWMQTNKYIFGDLNEAMDLWTRVSNALYDGAALFSDWRNELLEAWHEFGGYTAAVEAASNIWHAFYDTVVLVKDAIFSVSPLFDATDLIRWTENLRDLTGNIRKALEPQDDIEKLEETRQDFTDGLSETTNESKKLTKQVDKETKSLKKNSKQVRISSKLTKSLNKTSDKKGRENNANYFDKIDAGIDATLIEKASARGATAVMQARNRIYQLQKALESTGYLAAQSFSNGIYGPETQEAVAKLQKDIGVNVTGLWDEITAETARANEAFATYVGYYKHVDKYNEQIAPRIKTIVQGLASISAMARKVWYGVKRFAKGVIDLFGPLIDPLTRLASFVAVMFTNLNQAISKNKVNGFIDGLIEKLGPLGSLIKVTGDLLNNFLDGYLYFISTLPNGLKKSTKTGKTYINGAKITFASFFDYIGRLIANTPVMKVFIGAANIIIGVANTVTKVVAFGLNTILALLKLFSPILKPIVQVVVTAGALILATVVTVFSKIINTVRKAIGILGNGGSIADVFAAILPEDVFEGLKSRWESIKKWLTEIPGNISSFFTEVKTAVVDNGITAGIEVIKNKIKSLLNYDDAKTFGENFLGWIESFKQSIADKFESIKAAFLNSDLVKTVKETAPELYDSIVSKWNTFAEWLSGLATRIGSAVTFIAETVSGFFSALFPKSNLSSSLEETYGSNGIAGVFDSIKSAIKSLIGWDDTKTVGQNVGDMISNLLTSITTAFSNFKKALSEGDGIGAAIAGLFTDFDFGKLIIPVAIGAGGMLVTGIIRGIKSIKGALGQKSLLSLIAAPLIKNVPAVAGTVAGAFSGGLEGALYGGGTFAPSPLIATLPSLAILLGLHLDDITNFFSDALKAIKENGFWKALQEDIYPKTLDYVKEKWQSFIDFLFGKEGKDGASGTPGLFKNIQKQLDKFIKWLNGEDGIITKIKSKWQEFIGSLTFDVSIGSEVAEGVEGLETPLDSLKRLVGNVLKTILSGFGTIVELGKQAAGFAGDFIKSLKPLVKPLADFAGLVGQMFQNLFKGLSSGEGGDLAGFLASIRSSVDSFANYITGVAASITEFLNTFIAEFATVSKDGQTAVEKSSITFTNFISALMNAGKKAAVTVAKNTADTLRPVIDAFKTVFNFLIEHIDTILNFVAALGTLKLNSAINNVSKAFKQFGKALILKNGGEIDTFKESVKAITILVATLVGSFILLGNIPTDKIDVNFEKFMKFLIDFGLIVAIIGAVFGKFETIKEGLKNFSDSVKDMGMGILAMVGAVAAMAVVEEIFKDSDSLQKAFEKIGIFIVAMTLIEIALIGISAIFDKQKTDIAINAIKDMGLGLLAISGSVAILAATHKLFDDSAIEAFEGIKALVIILGAVMAAIIGLASKSDEGKVDASVKGITSIGIAVLIISFAVRNIAGKMKWNAKTQSALDNVEIIIFELGAIAAAIGKWHTDFKEASGSLTAILLMAGAIIGILHFIVPVINATKGVDATSLGITMLTIIVALGAMLGAMVLVNKLAKENPDTKAILGVSGAMLIIAGAISLIAGVIASVIPQIKNVQWEVVGAFVIGIAAIVLAIGHIAPALEKIDPLALAKAGLGLLLFLAELGVGISAFVGLVGITISTVLESIGGSLVTFGGGLANFSDSMSGVDTGSLTTKFNELSEKVVPEIASFMAKLVNIGTWKKRVDDLKTIGGSLLIFSGDIEKLKAPQEGILDTIAKEVEDFVGKIRNLGDISDVSGALSSIGGAMEIYNAAASGFGFDSEGNKVDIKAINTEDIRTAFASIKDAIPFDEIKDVAEYAENGSKDLTPITTGIGAMGAAVKSYADNISALKDAPIDEAKGVIEMVSGLYDDLASDDLNGVMDILHTKHDAISQFGDDLANLGTALGTYADSIKNFDGKSVKRSNSVLKVVKSINTDLPTTGGFFKKLFYGEKSFSQFIANLQGLGGGLASYANATAGGDFSKSDEALKAVRKIAIIMAKVEKTGGVTGWFTGDKKISAIGNGLKELGESLVNFQKALTDGGFKYTAVADAITAIKDLAIAWASIDATTLQYSGYGGKGALQLLGEDIAAFLASLVGGIDSSVTENPELDNKIKAIGVKFISKIREGMLEGKTAGEDEQSFVSIIGDIAGEIKEQDYQPFFDLGKYLVNSIADGMEDDETLKRFAEVAKTLSDNVASAFESNDIIVAPATEENKKKLKKTEKDISRYSEIINDLKSLIPRYGTSLTARSGLNANKIGETAYNDLIGLLNGEDNPLTQIFTKYKTDKLSPEEQAWIDEKLDIYGYTIAEKIKTLNTDDITSLISGNFDSLLATGVKKTPLDETTKASSEAVGTAMSATMDITKENEYQTFYDAGKYFAFAIADGMKDQEAVDRIIESAHILANGVITAFGSQNISIGAMNEVEGDKNSKSSGVDYSKLFTTATTLGKILGANLDAGTLEGITENAAPLVNAFVKAAVTDPIKAANDEAEINSPSKVTKLIGKYLMQGINVGIKSERRGLKDVFVESITAAYDAAKKALGINSPSKATEYLGEMTGEGYVKGLNKSKRKVKSAAEELGEVAVDAIWVDEHYEESPVEVMADTLSENLQNSTEDIEKTGKNLKSAINGVKTYINSPQLKDGIYYYKTTGTKTSSDKKGSRSYTNGVQVPFGNGKSSAKSGSAAKNAKAAKTAALDASGISGLTSEDVSDELAPTLSTGLDDSIEEALGSSKLTKGNDIWSPLKESFTFEFDANSVSDMVKGLNLDTSFGDAFKGILTTVDENGNEVGILDGFINGLKDQFGSIFGGEGGLGDILSGGISGILSKVFNLDDPDSPFASVGNMLEALVKKVFGLEGTVGDAVGGVVKEVGDAIGGEGEGGLFGIVKSEAKKLIDKIFGDGGAVDSASIETGLNTQLSNVNTDKATESLKENMTQSMTDAVTNLGVDGETAKNNLVEPLENSLKAAADGVDVDNVWDGYVDKTNKKLASDLNTSPNLRPVIDISSITDNPKTFQKAIGMQGMMDSIGATTSATLANGISLDEMETKLDAIATAVDNYSKTMSANTSSISDKFDQLERNIENLRIYLDSDAIVAGTVSKMDRALGKRQIAAGKKY